METLQRTANRGSISTGFDIDNSIKTQANAGNEWFYRSSPTTGNKRTFTFSFWIKRTQLDGYQADNYLMSQGSNARFHFAHHTLRFMFDGGSTELEADAKLRDTSAWYHIVIAVDTTQSTAANRVKAYLNGQDYDWNNTKYPSQNQEGSWMSGTNMYFNTRDGDGSYDNSGYWSEVVVIDGQQLAPTDFGEYDDSGIWKPKDLSDLTFGSEGFYYKFDNASSLGEDSSGNGNDATLNNITAADQATDSPTNNFCTLNPLYNYAYGNTITEGATKIYGAANNWGGGKATFGLTSGKWYWEIKQLANGNTFMGLQTDGEDNISSGNAQSQNTSVVFYTDGTLQYSNGSESTTSAANSIAANSIVGFALDLDSATQTIKVYNNNSLVTAFGSSGTANLSTYNIADKTVFPFVALYDRTVNMNFGGYTVSSISSAASDENGYGTFEYAPPSGYYALCTKNLAEYG